MTSRTTAAALIAAAASFTVLPLSPASAAPPRTVFEKTWGGPNPDRAEGVAIAPDGSIYTAGETQGLGAGGADAFLLKYSAAGALLWQRTYGTNGNEPFFYPHEFATDVAVAADGSAFVTGSFSDSRTFVCRFSPAGDLLWQRTWGNDTGLTFDFAEGAAAAPDGGVYICGLTTSFGAGEGDFFVAKFDSAGNLVWDRTWGGAGYDFGRDVAVAPDGSIYLVGEGNSFFANDAYVVKLDSSGNLLWDRAWRHGDISEISGAEGVAVAADGSVFVVGRATETGFGQHVFLLKFSAAGDLLAEELWGDGLSSGMGIAVAGTGDVYITGNTGAGEGNGDAFIVHFLASGRARAALTWGGPGNDSGQSIAIAADGIPVVAGWVENPPYVLGRAAKRTKSPDSFLGIPNGTVAPAAGTVEIPPGLVMTPAGSETYAGATDASLFKARP